MLEDPPAPQNGPGKLSASQGCSKLAEFAKLPKLITPLFVSTHFPYYFAFNLSRKIDIIRWAISPSWSSTLHFIHISVYTEPFNCHIRKPSSSMLFFPWKSLLWEGNGTPLQYSCLGNPMDGGAWWAAVHRVTKSQTHWVTSLSLFTFIHWRRKWQHTPIFLPGESQGREPGGLPSMGSHRVGHDWRDLAAAASSETWSWRAWVQSHLLSEPRVTDLFVAFYRTSCFLSFSFCFSIWKRAVDAVSQRQTLNHDSPPSISEGSLSGPSLLPWTWAFPVFVGWAVRETHSFIGDNNNIILSQPHSVVYM